MSSNAAGPTWTGDTGARWSAMTEVDTRLPADINEDVDPRWVRSRTRLLDAAAELLRAGGIEAVTIDAVTKQSRVARTTLYRHFGCSSDLLAATLEQLVPPITQPPSTGSLRDRLVEVVCRQAALYKEAPLHLTTLAWLALRSNTDDATNATTPPPRHPMTPRRSTAQFFHERHLYDHIVG